MKKIFKIIKNSKRVAVFAHQSPDGDCLGSSYAISFLCQKFGKQVDVFIDDDLTKNVKYGFVKFDNLNRCEFDAKNYDLLISTDVAASRLLGKYADEFQKFDNKIVIDHHTSRDLEGKYTYVEYRSSCAEIVYEILRKSKVKITKDVATMLYLGVSDDTGCFMHDNTTSKTHRIAGDLIDLGADISLINYRVFKLEPIKTFNMAKLLNQSIVMEDGLTYNVVTYDLMVKNGYTTNDLGNYINTLLNLEGTKVAVLLVEKQKNVFRLNFRCLKGYDVSIVANQFNGGGHTQASGGTFYGTLKEALSQVIKASKEAVKKGNDNV